MSFSFSRSPISTPSLIFPCYDVSFEESLNLSNLPSSSSLCGVLAYRPDTIYRRFFFFFFLFVAYLISFLDLPRAAHFTIYKSNLLPAPAPLLFSSRQFPQAPAEVGLSIDDVVPAAPLPIWPRLRAFHPRHQSFLTPVLISLPFPGSGLAGSSSNWRSSGSEKALSSGLESRAVATR